MSFIAVTPPNHHQPEEKIANFSFFPCLSLTDFREAMRVDAVTTEDRARHALHTAMLEVNSRLAEWVASKQKAGFSALSDLPERFGNPDGSNQSLYFNAVWSLAKAILIERYRDYDTSRTGNEKADELTPVSDDYRRDAAWALNDLMQNPRVIVELI